MSSDMADASASEMAYEQAHAGESRGVNMAVSNGICISIAFIAVLLRFVSRRLSRTSNGPDDWWAWTALVFFALYIVAYSCNVHYGLGRHSILIPNLKGYMITSILAAILYNTTIFAIKVSLLFFYRRFFPQQWFKYALLATGGILTSYTLAYNLVAVFQCVPIKAAWDESIPHTCVDLGAEYFVVGILNVLMDITILVLPVPLVWQLQIARNKKWLVLGTFMLGGCACIVSIIRLIYVRDFKGVDATWNNVHTTELSSVELGIGMLSACMPACRPLYNYIFHGKATSNGKDRRTKGTTTGAIKMSNITANRPGGRRRLDEDSEDDVEKLWVDVPLGNTTNVQGSEEPGYENHGGILVTREFTALDTDQTMR